MSVQKPTCENWETEEVKENQLKWSAEGVWKGSTQVLPPPPGRVLAQMDYLGMCHSKEYGWYFRGLVINKVSISAILDSNMVWFLHPGLESTFCHEYQKNNQQTLHNAS